MTHRLLVLGQSVWPGPKLAHDADIETDGTEPQRQFSMPRALSGSVYRPVGSIPGAAKPNGSRATIPIPLSFIKPRSLRMHWLTAISILGHGRRKIVKGGGGGGRGSVKWESRSRMRGFYSHKRKRAHTVCFSPPTAVPLLAFSPPVSFYSPSFAPLLSAISCE